MLTLNLNVHNETSNLKTVYVGIADDFGNTPKKEDCYDPKSLFHVQNGTFPNQVDLINENKNFLGVLKKYGVTVLQPTNISNVNQIFVRDIAFVIGNFLIISNIVKNREKEMLALNDLYLRIKNEHIVFSPPDVRVEGGDVLLNNEHIFIGYSEDKDFQKYIVSRTNKNAISFIQKLFPNKNVVGFELNKSDIDAKKNALHLDCCFQPIGCNKAILYKKGFKHKKDINFLVNYFGEENIIEIDTEEMYNMNSNVFSLSEKIIVSDKSFTRLNLRLKELGFVVEEISYMETSKMEGLFRCSTMPLIRE